MSYGVSIVRILEKIDRVIMALHCIYYCITIHMQLGHLWRSLRWRHNGHDDVSNHQPHHCLLNLYSDADQRKHQSSTSHWPLCGKFTGTGEFPTQMASNAENVSIWWRHHVIIMKPQGICNPHVNLSLFISSWGALFQAVLKVLTNPKTFIGNILDLGIYTLANGWEVAHVTSSLIGWGLA